MDIQKEFTFTLMKLADTIIAESQGSYYPTEFRKAVEDNGGLKVARDLVYQPVSEGFLRLLNLNRTDLSVEALIISSPHFHCLFTEEELAICRRRVDTLTTQPCTPPPST